MFCASGLASFAALLVLDGPSTAWLLLTAAVLLAALLAWATHRTRARPVAFALGWLTLAAVVLLFVAWMDGSLGDFFHTKTFDRESWIEADTDGRARLRMVDHLRASGRLERLTLAESLRLLGEPSQRAWRGDERVWVWRLGFAGMMIDPSYLLLTFGPDGRVASHAVVED